MHLYVWHDAFTCVTWCLCVCNLMCTSCTATHCNTLQTLQHTWCLCVCNLMCTSWVCHDQISFLDWNSSLYTYTILDFNNSVVPITEVPLGSPYVVHTHFDRLYWSRICASNVMVFFVQFNGHPVAGTFVGRPKRAPVCAIDVGCEDIYIQYHAEEYVRLSDTSHTLVLHSLTGVPLQPRLWMWSSLPHFTQLFSRRMLLWMVSPALNLQGCLWRPRFRSPLSRRGRVTFSSVDSTGLECTQAHLDSGMVQ